MHKTIIAAVLTSVLIPGYAVALEDIHTGTVIVGSGVSGLTTAILLKEHKQNVLVLEKMPFMGGTTNLAAQYFVSVGTKDQVANGKELSVPDYIQRTAKTGRNSEMLPRTEQRMFDSQKSIDWLNSLGAGLTRPVSDYQMGISDGSSLGVRLMKILSARAKELSIPVKMNSKVLDLIIRDGRAVGVVVENGKEKYKVFADNVVLATGNFNQNQKLISKYAPQWKGLPTTTAVSSTGDGLILAEKYGVNIKNAGEVGLNPSIHSQGGKNVSMSAARLEGGIMVNLKGDRFCNDYWPDYTKMAKAMLEQPEGKSFVIIDGKSMKASKRLQSFLKSGYFVEAQTIPELAQKIGIPPENLEKTIKRYAEFVRNGKDLDFGRSINMKTDFSTPPYYASAILPGTQVSVGGVDVNDFMQCVKADGKVIPNLYAVGELTYDSGTPHGVWSGRRAAEHILSK